MQLSVDLLKVRIESFFVALGEFCVLSLSSAFFKIVLLTIRN
jgi:hypothetical protein